MWTFTLLTYKSIVRYYARGNSTTKNVTLFCALATPPSIPGVMWHIFLSKIIFLNTSRLIFVKRIIQIIRLKAFIKAFRAHKNQSFKKLRKCPVTLPIFPLPSLSVRYYLSGPLLDKLMQSWKSTLSFETQWFP